MKFGKLEDISGVDFKLPEVPASTLDFLNQSSSKSKAFRVYVGATGWAMKEWVGTVYPPKTKSNAFLYHYARQFNTIELNSTHYGMPKPEILQKWYEETPEDFRFCPKVPQSISHSRLLGIGTDLLPDFFYRISILQDKLGCCFLQLPPHFDTSKWSNLQQFINALPEKFPISIEFRHLSWFNQLDLWVDYFRQKHVGTVITDVAGRRDVMHFQLTTPTGMVRFVGNGLHHTDFTRLDEWVEKLTLLRKNGLHHLYFFTHEPDNVMAPELSIKFLEKAINIPDINARGPVLYNSSGTSGLQTSLF